MSEARRIPETGQLSFPFPAQPPAAEVEPLVTAPIRNGFLIRLGPRDAIAVRLVAYGSPRDDVFTCLKVERIACPPSLAAPARDPDPEYFALPEYWPLENRVVRAAMAARGPRGWALDGRERERRIARTLTEVHGELLRRVGRDVVEAQETCREATGEVAGIMLFPELYREPNRHLLKDILRYPAACVAARRVHQLVRPEDWADPEVAAAAGPGADPGDRVASGRPRWGPEDLEILLPALRDWRRRLSVGGKGYRSLNITLDRFRAGTPPDLLLELRRLRLPRPLAERSEFLLITGWSHRSRGRGRSAPAFLGATAERIRRAMAVVSREVGRPLDPNLDRDVLHLVEYLLDCRELDYGGDLVGLARRAVVWHRREHRRTEAERRAWEALHGGGEGALEMPGDEEPPPPAETPTALPPIPLPEDKRIRFLDNSGAVVECGFELRTCLRSYAAGAVDGRYYLFHVRFEGGEAVVQVDPRGRVVQSRGPANRNNEAARWAATKLAEWGRGFPEGGLTTGAGEEGARE